MDFKVCVANGKPVFKIIDHLLRLMLKSANGGDIASEGKLYLALCP